MKKMKKFLLTLLFTVVFSVSFAAGGCIRPQTENPYDTTLPIGAVANLIVYVTANRCFFDSEATKADGGCVWGF